jgi:biotin carboxylase
MDIDGTSYRGVTVGPGVLPDAQAEAATRFGLDVGRALAAEGYRGWYDVDFVMDRTGRLAPTEINLRLTGPAVAFMIQARIDRVSGGRHLVRTLDHLPLGARLPPAALSEHLGRVARQCRSLGATLLPTVPTASFEPSPYVGVALAARTQEDLDAAESAVRCAGSAVGEIFEDVDIKAPWGAIRRMRPPRRRRS